MKREARGPVRCTPYRPVLVGKVISTGALATHEMKHAYYLFFHVAIIKRMSKREHGARTSGRPWPSSRLVHY